ncbi:hypothetical protein V2J09_018313, partial [Rumex salicifolius]
TSHAKNIFELLHCDPWGSYDTPTYSGHKYFLTVVDDRSRCVWSCFMKYKTEPPLLPKRFITRMEITLIPMPHEVLFNEPSDYTRLSVFGCLCYASTSSVSRKKFEPRVDPCVFLGYPFGFKGYKINRDVHFVENSFPFSSPTHVTTSTQPTSPTTHIDFLEKILVDYSLSPIPPSFDPLPINEEVSHASSSPPPPSSPPRASTRTKRPPSWLQDYVCIAPSSSPTLSSSLAGSGKTSPYPMSCFLSYD